ncbi:MAG TPA: hypothetical protein HPQ03_09095 [Deltaproteobacteria bacterium]|nr:hypothetical protein [Deltaproteobacteria bacterium]
MGEIKSTLDIVMEKTKHLSLSEEEKEAQQIEDIRKTVKGLIQKYKDRIIAIKQLEDEWIDLEKENRLSDRQILMDEIMDHLHLDLDNSLLMTSLKAICGRDTGPLESLLEDYINKKTEVVQERHEAIQKEIAVRYHISGSAVVPNLETDSDWAEAMKAFENNYQEKLEAEKANYK